MIKFNYMHCIQVLKINLFCIKKLIYFCKRKLKQNIMKTVKVIFADSKYNYSTSVNPNVSDEDLRKYFVGTSFDLGAFPIENFQKCIDIEIK